MPSGDRASSTPDATASHRFGLTALVSWLASAFEVWSREAGRKPKISADRGHRLSNVLHVLVVDDNPAYIGNACELLGHFGIVPMLAADGAEAVALACSHEFDMILMDLQMPVLDGLAATKQIRRFEDEQSGARAAILAFTSSAPDRRLMQCCGLDDVLEKPCTLGTLQACLSRWLPQMGLMA